MNMWVSCVFCFFLGGGGGGGQGGGSEQFGGFKGFKEGKWFAKPKALQ